MAAARRGRGVVRVVRGLAGGACLLALPALLGAAGSCAEEGPWTRRAPLPTARQEVAVAALGGEVYVLGGFQGFETLATVEVWSPEDDAWREVAPLPVPLHHTAAVAVDGELLVIGGLRGLTFTASDRVFAYDPALDRWEERAPLPRARGAVGAALLDGRVYVAGGLPVERERDFAVYDPASDAWAELAPMPTPRNHLAAVALDGRFHAVGGRSGAGIGGVTGAHEAWNPASGDWEALAALPTPRGGIAGAAVAGRLLVLGGEGSEDDPQGVFDANELFDPRGGDWRSLAPMPTARHGIGAAVVAGRVHVPGGGPVEGFSVTDVHSVYVPAAEPDFDGDGVPLASDACPFAADPGNADTDGDGTGDACECGDASGDGRVDAADARRIQRCAVGAVACPALCDADGEGACTAADARRVQRYAVGALGKADLACAEKGP